MVQIEGRGLVAPCSVKVQIEPWEMKTIAMQAQQRNDFRKYGYRRDKWGAGLRDGVSIDGIGDVERAVLPIMAGMVGEYALCKKVNCVTNRQLLSLDVENKQKGDGGIDVDILGTGVQVKTRQRNYRQNLVRRVSESKKMCALTSDWFVFCQWTHGAAVELLGWVTLEDVHAARCVRSKIADFYNLVIPDSTLQPMGRLFTEVKTRILERSQEWH